MRSSTQQRARSRFFTANALYKLLTYLHSLHVHQTEWHQRNAYLPVIRMRGLVDSCVCGKAPLTPEVLWTGRRDVTAVVSATRHRELSAPAQRRTDDSMLDLQQKS